jgi:hypothetical protein
MIYRVYAESGIHAEAVCIVDAAIYDGGIADVLAAYFKRQRMIVTEGAEEGITIGEVFAHVRRGTQ